MERKPDSVKKRPGGIFRRILPLAMALGIMDKPPEIDISDDDVKKLREPTKQHYSKPRKAKHKKRLENRARAVQARINKTWKNR